MTLILNEIHIVGGLSSAFIVAAADRRISNPDGSYGSTRRKLFAIPRINGAVSYFGLAAWPAGKKASLCFSDWLPAFIGKQPESATIESFSRDLRESLNQTVPRDLLEQYPSGFHVCGYDRRGYPDFWFVSNIQAMEGFRYSGLRSEYIAESHFLGRDALSVYGWDESDPDSARNGIQTYRNGDYRAHVAAWSSLDAIYTTLVGISSHDFRIPKNRSEYGDFVRFKFEVVAYLYKKWAKQKIIGRPIDVLVLEND